MIASLLNIVPGHDGPGEFWLKYLRLSGLRVFDKAFHKKVSEIQQEVKVKIDENEESPIVSVELSNPLEMFRSKRKITRLKKVFFKWIQRRKNIIWEQDSGWVQEKLEFRIDSAFEDS